jgi:hypothetical protein
MASAELTASKGWERGYLPDAPRSNGDWMPN